VLLLNPQLVTFGSLTLDPVALISIDRVAARQVLDWSDAGPYPVLADAPEQRVTIKLVQDLSQDLSAPRPGDQATLAFHASPTLATATRRKLSCTAVVMSVTHELSLKRGLTRTIELAALSPDGATDPIAVTDAE